MDSSETNGWRKPLKAVLAAGGSATNNYLRRLHNLAPGMSWIVWAILPPKLWPKVTPKPKRAITFQEHRKIVAAEQKVERRLDYELLWELGGRPDRHSQSESR